MDFDGDGPDDGYKRRRRNSKRRYRAKKTAARLRNIAVLDFETDPFDNEGKQAVFPFLAVIYSDQIETITLWEDDWRILIQRLFEALEQLQEPFTIYAHNGGRFDYMYMMHMIDGRVKFKGRSLMSAKFGKHEIRDSLHIIPESLRNANRKTDIDYGVMHRNLREKHREEIISYCTDDCIATFEVIRAFVDKFGMPLTIGQAAMKELKKHYSFKRLNEPTDRYFRQWFFGGRTECLNKPGRYTQSLKLFDVNSMYPSVMAFQKHPIGNEFFVNDKITTRTAFIHLRCENCGGFISRLKNGELTTRQEIGEFWTTIHEYKVARELDLCRFPQVIKTIDFIEWSNFHDFVVPIYMKRDELKRLIVEQPNHSDRKSIEQDMKFYKYLLNNAYGKFAQNPRRFKEFYLTEPGKPPPVEWLYQGVDIQAQRMRFDLPDMEDQDRIDYLKRMRSLPDEETNDYWIWGIPTTEWRFNNVATAASITGAARAKLMEAKHHAINPLYCDTDSLICEDLPGIEIDAAKLGAWKCETEIVDFIMAGKKIYGYRTPKFDGKTLDQKTLRMKDGKLTGDLLGEVIRAKGQQGVTWHDLEATILGEVITKTMLGPTVTRTQTQHYMSRELRMTGTWQ